MHKGHKAYLAGGCVQDLLLEREPKDYDVATSATFKSEEYFQKLPTGRSPIPARPCLLSRREKC